jgi:hypothetical protein
VRPAVPIKIVDSDSQTFRGNGAEATLFRNIGKRSVAVVVKDEVRNGLILVRMAVGAVSRPFLAAIDVAAEVPV